MFEKGKVYKSADESTKIDNSPFASGKVYGGTFEKSVLEQERKQASQNILDSMIKQKREQDKKRFIALSNGTVPVADANEIRKNAKTNEIQPSLMEKVYLQSAKQKQFSGKKLDVPEIGVTNKFDVQPVKIPKNSSQAFKYNAENKAENLTKLEKSIINQPDFSAKSVFRKNIDGITDKKTYTDINGRNGIYKYMNADEVGIYNYMISNNDNAGARKYLLSIKPRLETLKAQDVASDNKGFLGFVEDVGTAVSSGFTGALTNMARTGVSGQIATGNNVGVLGNILEPTYIEKLYSEVRTNANDKNVVYGLFLDTLNNITAQVPQIAMGAAGGQGAYVLTMANQIIGASTTEAINQGYDGMKGIVYGVFDTALEFGTEYLLGGIVTKLGGTETNKIVKSVLNTIDNTISNKKVANALAKFVSFLFAGNAEGAEEFLQTYAEPVLRNIIYGESNKFTIETFCEAVKSYIVGFASGGLMDIPFLGGNLNQARAEIAGNFIKENAGVKSVLSLSEVTGNNSQLYSEIKSLYENGREIEDLQLGLLYGEAVEKFENISDEKVNIYAAKNVEKFIEIAKTEKTNKSNLKVEGLSAPNIETSNAKETTIKSNVNTENTDIAEVDSQVDGIATDSAETVTSEDAKKEGNVFNEPPMREIAQTAPNSDIFNMALNGAKPKNSRQLHIDKISSKLGLRVIWDESISQGKYNPKTKTIYINPNMQTAELYAFVFKHEFTHFLESKEKYNEFKSYVFNQSEEFLNWAREKLIDSDLSGEGSRAEINKRIVEHYERVYKSSTEISAYMRKNFNSQDAEKEVIADFVGHRLFTDERGLDTLRKMATQKPNLFQQIRDWIRSLISRLKGEAQNRSVIADLQKLEKKLVEVYKSANKNTAESGDVQYSLNVNAKSELHKALYDISYRNEVLLRDETPSIMLSQNGVKNRPMVMNASHIRENVFTEEEARKLGLKVDGDKHYHGLGEKFFLKIIDGLDNVKEAYRGTKYANIHSRRENYFLLVSEFKDQDGNIINVPVYIEEGAQCNRVYLKSNKIATVFGKDDFRNYINNQLKNKNLVRIKNKSNTISEGGVPLTPAYENIALNDIILNEEDSVNSNISEEAENYSDTSDFEQSSIPVSYTDKLVNKFIKGEIDEETLKKRINNRMENLAKNSQWYEKYLESQNTKRGELTRLRKQNEKRHNYIETLLVKMDDLRAEKADKSAAAMRAYESKQKNVEAIRQGVSKLETMRRTNSEKKNIPEKLKPLVDEVVRLFLTNDTSPFNNKNLERLYSLYTNLEATEENETAGYDPETAKNLQNLAESIEGKKLIQLKLSELQKIRGIIDNITCMVRREKEIFVNGKKQEFEQYGREAMRQLKKNKDFRMLLGELHSISKVKNYALYEMLKPTYFFSWMGGTFKELFSDLSSAQKKYGDNCFISKAFMEEVKEKYNFSKWKDDKLEFTHHEGERFDITVPEAMLIYAWHEREQKLQTNHLMDGGIVFNSKFVKTTLKDANERYKQDLKEYEENGYKGKKPKIIDRFSSTVNTEAKNITEDDFSAIFNALTEEQMLCADEVVEYLSTVMAELGNEVSMELFGIRKYNDRYYIPFVSSEYYLWSKAGTVANNESRLKHTSFTMNLQDGASTPLILSDFFEVASDHINRMCLYNAFTIPLENMNRIFNFSTTGTNVENIKAIITQKFGSDAEDYFKRFISDANGGVIKNPSEKITAKLVSNFKKTAVLLSASVGIRQYSAAHRAKAVVDRKYFRKTFLPTSERDFEQLLKYSGNAKIKKMGRFDTGMSVGAVEWLLKDKPEGLKDRSVAFLKNESGYRDDILAKFPEKMDELAWARIWAAVKAETADKTNLDIGSEEFLEFAGERFDEVVDLTQVYDSVLSRSQIMRSKSTSAEMVTAFMAESTTKINMLIDAAYKLNKEPKNKEVRKEVIKTLGAIIESVIWDSLLVAFVYAARDDDEDETYLEKYLGALHSTFLSGINPLNDIPYFRDVMTVIDGYTVERADMSVISDVIIAFMTLFNNDKKPLEKARKCIEASFNLFGVPIKNLWRDIEASINTLKTIILKKGDTDWKGIQYAISESSNYDIYEDLMRAAENDDEKEYQKIYKHLMDNGADDADINKGIKSAFKQRKDVQEETEKYIEKLKGNKTFENFEDEDKTEVENNIKTAVALSKKVEVTEREPDEYDKLYEAYRTNRNRYETLRKQMLDSGKTEKQIEDGFNIAKYAYMKSVGIDLQTYFTYKKAVSKKYADKDGSGGVNKAEKQKALNEFDADSKTRAAIRKYLQ